MYQKLFESTKLVAPENRLDTLAWLFYVPDWDACLMVGRTEELARVWRDGTKIRYGRRSGGFEPLGRVEGALAWWSRWTGRIHPAFVVTGLPDENEILNPNWAIPYALGPGELKQALVDDVKGLYLHQGTNKRLDLYDLKTGQVVRRINHDADRFTTLVWADTGLVVGVVRGTGAVRFIDYYRGEVVETGRVDPCQAAAYDSRHHNFITVGTDRKVRVYCRETLPAQLSSPQFEPAQVRGLKGNLVKTRLTGTDGEPCRGWWVHWELMGSGNHPPMGCLDKAVSRTDSDGWAYNLYYGPDDGATGQNRIRVSVIY